MPPELVPLAIDEFPILFIAAAAAKGTTVVSGAEELRKKETDRIAVMARALEAVGIEVEERPDGARIVGGRLRGGTVDSRGDHRIAMSFAVASLRAEAPIEILNTAEVATSFPNFLDVARAAGLDVDGGGPRVTQRAVPVVTIDGPSGSGKGTIGRLAGAEARLALPRQRRPVSARGARGSAAAGSTSPMRAALAEAAATLNARFAPAAAGERVLLDGVDVSDELRTERAGDAASKVAAVPEVRDGAARAAARLCASRRGSSPTAATWAPWFSPTRS